MRADRKVVPLSLAICIICLRSARIDLISGVLYGIQLVEAKTVSMFAVVAAVAVYSFSIEWESYLYVYFLESGFISCRPAYAYVLNASRFII